MRSGQDGVAAWSSKSAFSGAAHVVRLLRPLNFVMFWIGVGVGGVLGVGLEAFEEGPVLRLLIAALSASLIGGAANSLNDVFDEEIDRVNRPDRPLPSGLVSVRTAWWVWGAGSAAGIALSFWLTAGNVALAFLAVGLCFVYNARLKRVPLAGNVVVAALLLALVVYGGWAVGAPGPALVGGVFAFLTTLAREIVKDVQDAAGDAVVRARTLPLAYGTHFALRLAAAVVLSTVVLTAVPFLVLGYSSLYLFVVLAADAFLLAALRRLREPITAAEAGRASGLLKAAMLAGMAALALVHF